MTDHVQQAIRDRIEHGHVPAGDLAQVRARAGQRSRRRRAGLAAAAVPVVAAMVAGVGWLVDAPPAPVVVEQPPGVWDGFPLHGYDPQARTAPDETFATTPMGDVAAWAVKGGGLCFEIAGRTACTDQTLETGSADALAYVVEEGATCTIGTVADGVSSVAITHLNEAVAAAQLSPAIEGGIRGFASCIDAVSGPAALSSAHDRSVAGDAVFTDGVSTVAEELRPSGTPARSQVAAEVRKKLDGEPIVSLLNEDRRDAAIEAFRRQLAGAPLPAGVVSSNIETVLPIDFRSDRATLVGIQALVTISTQTDEPFCLGVYVDTRIAVSVNSQLPPGPCDVPSG